MQRHRRIARPVRRLRPRAPAPHAEAAGYPLLDQSLVRAALQAGVGNSTAAASASPLSETEEEEAGGGAGSFGSSSRSHACGLGQIDRHHGCIDCRQAQEEIDPGGSSRWSACRVSQLGRCEALCHRSTSSHEVLDQQPSQDLTEHREVDDGQFVWQDKDSEHAGTRLVGSGLGGYKTLAHSAWGIGRVLDCLMIGRIDEARARSCLMLLQLDQTAAERGGGATFCSPQPASPTRCQHGRSAIQQAAGPTLVGGSAGSSQRHRGLLGPAKKASEGKQKVRRCKWRRCSAEEESKSLSEAQCSGRQSSRCMSGPSGPSGAGDPALPKQAKVPGSSVI